MKKFLAIICLSLIGSVIGMEDASSYAAMEARIATPVPSGLLLQDTPETALAKIALGLTLPEFLDLTRMIASPHSRVHIATAYLNSQPPRSDILLRALNSNEISIKAANALTKAIAQGSPFWPYQRDSQGNTPLILAAEHGYINAVEALIAHKAHLDRRNNDGSTALMAAIANGYPNIATLLVEAEASVNRLNNNGESAVRMAQDKGYTKLVELLKFKGANLELKFESDSPLYVAAMADNIQLVSELLDKGANPNIPNNDGMTPLYIAAMEGHTQTVVELLNKKADPNISNNNGRIPLLESAWGGHTQIASELLKHGADPDVQDSDGKTPLFAAARHGHTQTVTELLAHKANPNIPDNDGMTPLFAAAMRGDAYTNSY